MERAFEKLQIDASAADGRRTENRRSPTCRERSLREPGRESAARLWCLLDLSMPGKHGLDVLQWIRSQPTLAGLPVIALTSSNQESDIHRAYLLGANGYLIKPGDPDDLIRIVKGMHRHWLSENAPPGPFVDLAAVPPPVDKE